jgi:ATP-dependent DNA ligase
MGPAFYYTFDMLTGEGDDIRMLPLSIRKTNLARLLARRRSDGIFIALIYSGPRAGWALRGWYQSIAIEHTGRDGRRIGLR